MTVKKHKLIEVAGVAEYNRQAGRSIDILLIIY